MAEVESHTENSYRVKDKTGRTSATHTMNLNKKKKQSKKYKRKRILYIDISSLQTYATREKNIL